MPLTPVDEELDRVVPVVEWLARATGVPLSVDTSRPEGMIGALTGRPVEEGLAGSISTAVLAVRRGADLLRVHHVAATHDAPDVPAAVERPREERP